MAALLTMALLLATAGAAAADDFRQANDLTPHQPPDWFLRGCFVASEVSPRHVFGSVGDFARELEGTTTWLIEAAERDRVDKAIQAGQTPEHTLYLEQDAPGGKVYWVFVALPHQDPQQWFRERWDYHKSKAEGYYGQTLEGLKKAFAQGLAVKGELRFRVVGGQAQVQPPEDALLARGKPAPVFDLRQGGQPGGTPGGR